MNSQRGSNFQGSQNGGNMGGGRGSSGGFTGKPNPQTMNMDDFSQMANSMGAGAGAGAGGGGRRLPGNGDGMTQSGGNMPAQSAGGRGGPPWAQQGAAAGDGGGATPAQDMLYDLTSRFFEATTSYLPDTTTGSPNIASSNSTGPYDTHNITYPAPCYVVGRKNLIVLYFGCGFIIPVVALSYLLITLLYRTVKKKLRMRQEYEIIDEDEDLEPDSNAPQPHLDKIKMLVLSRKNRSKISVWIADASSPQTKPGLRMMITGLICASISLLIYLVAVSKELQSLEFCGTMPNAYQLIDLVANLFLLFYFVVRIIGNEKKFKILIELYSIVDYFTIPAVIVGVCLDRYFTGFTFIRAYNFLWLVDILGNKGVFRTPNSIKLTYLITLVLVTLMVATGFLHMVENSGDFYPLVPRGTFNGQVVSYWRCFLYLYGKVTLIDLSGIRIQTRLGKLIIYAFQLIALGIIGRAIPQIMALLRITPEYDKDYIAPERFLHIIISGHVNTPSVTAFLREFYHPDRDLSEHFKVVILGDKPPDEGMERLMKQFFNRADYRRGSILSMLDINRVKLFEAAGTLLVADKAAAESDAEDAVNIMRVVSIKNFKDDARVIVQAYLQNIPSWNVQAGDLVICIAELRLGLLAQSCYAPGFSTLMANFFTTRTYSHRKKFHDAWVMDYTKGTSLEMYARRLSDAFAGMSFTQACDEAVGLFHDGLVKNPKPCFYRFLEVSNVALEQPGIYLIKLWIVLVAVKVDPYDLATMPRVNPSELVIEIGSIGYFVADSTEEVERAIYYCASCHRDVDDPEMIKKCSCVVDSDEDGATGILYQLVTQNPDASKKIAMTKRDDLFLEGKIWSYIRRYPTSPPRSVKDGKPPEPQLSGSDAEENVTKRPDVADAMYDSTGMFHWCPGRPLESVLLSRQQSAKKEFSGHIVICILSQPGSQIVGLHSFILPLRSAVITPEELRDVVILSDHAFMKKEWQYLLNLPRVHVVRGTALNRADLRSITLNTCKMCVIIGAPSTGAQMQSVDNALIDKAVILATLNVRAMRFSDDEAVEMFPSNPASEVGSISETSSMYQQRISLKTRARQTGYEVPLITDLLRDTNAQFLDQDDDDLPDTEFYMTQPYACGRCFSGTVLDLLMITSFFNPVIVNVFRTMIFGGASLELEKILAEGAGLIGGANISRPAERKNQVIVNQFSISSGPLSVHAESTYGGLFIDALVTYGRLCLGVYRKMDPTNDSSRSSKRFVICNPPEDFILDPTDMIYSLDRPGGAETAIHDQALGLAAFLSSKDVD